MQMRRIAALLLAAAFLLAGCGERGSGQDGSGGQGDFGLWSSKREEQADQTANRTSLPTGRFVEKEIPFAENSVMREPAAILPTATGLYLLDLQGVDAQVVLEGKNFEDPDGGPEIKNVSLSELPLPIREYRKTSDYMVNMAMAGNGARMYTVFTLNDEGGEQYQYDKYFMDAAGNEILWNAEGAVDASFDASYYCGDDGYFYVLVRDAACRLYRVDSGSGETEYLMDFSELESTVDQVAVFGGRIFVATYKKIYLFDLDTLEQAEEDKVLNELIGKSFGKSNGHYAHGYLLCPGEGDSVYVVTENGLYRHVLYGNVSELLIDGSLCSLGDVSKLFVDMYVEADGENGMPVFYLLYDNGTLMRFAYDPQMPSVPEQTIVLYSLKENRDIRLVLSAYQALHPETYVRYEIGMSGADGTTREDALNSLATRIAAGEGPDIFLLDDLPYSSYAEKGVLMDLSGIYGELKAEQNYFDNIVDALRQGEKLYTIPMLFAVPMLVGDGEALAGITDLESLVQAVENSVPRTDELRVGFGDAFTTLQYMSYSNSDMWFAEDGSLDREGLERFLILCKRMYEADLRDISPEKLAKRMEWKNNLNYASDYYWESSDIGNMVLDMIIYGFAFAVGVQSGDINAGFNFDYAVIRQAGAEYKLLPGEGNVCLPYTLLGVNASTPMPEAASDFVRYALSDYLSETKYVSGIPINRDVLLAMEENPYGAHSEDYLSYGIGYADENGDDVFLSVEVFWQRPEVYEAYNAMLDSLNAVNVCQHEMLAAVLEKGVPALTGEKSVEEAVNDITKKMQLYLAE